MSLKIDNKKNISLKYNSEFIDGVKKDSYLDLVNGIGANARAFRPQFKSSIYANTYNESQQLNPFSCNKEVSRPPPSDKQWQPKHPIKIVDAAPWAKGQSNHTFAYRGDYHPNKNNNV